MTLTPSPFTACLLLPLLAACGSADGAPGWGTSEPLGSSQALLHVDVEALLAEDDVEQLAFEAVRVSCDGEAVEPSRTTSHALLSELLLPVENPSLGGKPLSPDSEHAFADVLMALQPGCYDITLTPLGSSGAASTHCSPASASSIRIEPELTTEIVLVSQCSSQETGLGDTVLAFNHAPTLSQPTYADTRFVRACRPTRVCVTASDAEHDPLELVWEVAPDSDPRTSQPAVVSSTTGEGTLEECVNIVPRASALFDYRVTAYDRATRAGAPVRIESLLAASGSTATSHASLTFSLLASSNGNGNAQCKP